MILVVDNYDSFVYNVARYVRELDGDVVVRRHDAVTLVAVAAAYQALVDEECDAGGTPR